MWSETAHGLRLRVELGSAWKETARGRRQRVNQSVSASCVTMYICVVSLF